MRDIRRSRLLSSRVLLWVNIVLVIFLSISFGREYVRNRQIQRTIAALEKEEAELSVRNSEIASLNRELETGLYLEREARLRLGLVKPGERVVVVSSEDTQETSPDIGGEKLPDVSEAPDVSNPRRWWMYVTDPAAFDALVFAERAKL